MCGVKGLSLVAAALMASTAMVHAADLLPPLVEELPPEVVPHDPAGGWYIRGDIGYAKMRSDGVDYFQGAAFTGSFEQYDLDSTWTIQGGIGYQVTDYFRVDGTLKHYGSANFDGSSEPGPLATCAGGFGDFCSYNDDSELQSVTSVMANAYVDLGTIVGFTPYVGAGIGGARVKWGSLLNDQTCVGSGDDVTCSGTDFVHGGESNWRFAWAVHAGAAYDVSCRTKLDAGYTYTRVEGGAMFGDGVPVGGGASTGGYGFDRGFDIHEGRVGIRYALDDSGCGSPEPSPMVFK